MKVKTTYPEKSLNMTDWFWYIRRLSLMYYRYGWRGQYSHPRPNPEQQKREKIKQAKVKPIIYPDNCKFYFEDKNIVLAVIEQKPQMRSISLCNKRYLLSFPFIVFIIYITKSYGNYHFAELKAAIS